MALQMPPSTVRLLVDSRRQQELVWPANGLFPQPRQQHSRRMWPLAASPAAAARGASGSWEAEGMTDGSLKDKQWDHSMPHFCQGRG